MQKIGVIGAGSMGRGIAQHAAVYGHEVILVDINESTLNEAKAFIDRMVNRLAEKGKIEADEAVAIMGRIYIASDMSTLQDCDLVIEAVVEKLEIKKSIFQKLEGIVGKDCILASNTSSLSIASIAAACDEPSRVLGLHFFNPVPLMKLVEIIPAIQTDIKHVEQCKNLMNNWMKIPVIAKDTPGFIVNKVARPFYSEALRIYDEGMASFEEIDAAMTQEGGFRMGPFTLMDYIGNDVNYAVTESVFQSFYYDPRYKPSFTQKRLSEAGWLGRKTGRGYYNYSDEKKTDVTYDSDKLKSIFDRILLMLINEAADTLHLGIASKEDIDLAVTKGVNYPKGLLKWADEYGINRVVEGLDSLYAHYHEDRYRCSGLLRTMNNKNKKFYE